MPRSLLAATLPFLACFVITAAPVSAWALPGGADPGKAGAPAGAASATPGAPTPAPRLVTSGASAAAPDVRSGHFVIAATAGYALPWGELESLQNQSDLAGWGPSFGAELMLGISRYVLLGASGGYATFGGGDSCTGCSSTSYTLGVAAQYHIIDQTPFDPWLSFGVGYRALSIEGPGGAGAATGKTTYQGFDWAMVRAGGDYYPTGALGFGPFVELDLGTYATRSPGPIGDLAVHAFFTVGARVVLDPMGR